MIYAGVVICGGDSDRPGMDGELDCGCEWRLVAYEHSVYRTKYTTTEVRSSTTSNTYCQDGWLVGDVSKMS